MSYFFSYGLRKQRKLKRKNRACFLSRFFFTFKDVFFAEKRNMTRELFRQILTVCKTTQCSKFIRSPYSVMHRLFSLLFFSFNTQSVVNFVLAPSITILLSFTSQSHQNFYFYIYFILVQLWKGVKILENAEENRSISFY